MKKHLLKARLAEGAEILQGVLDAPFPHDLLEIRKEVERRYEGDEERARNHMDAYCTAELFQSELAKYRAAHNRAREFLCRHKEDCDG